VRAERLNVALRGQALFVRPQKIDGHCGHDGLVLRKYASLSKDGRGGQCAESVLGLCDCTVCMYAFMQRPAFVTVSGCWW
jgi:hypothetical protein